MDNILSYTNERIGIINDEIEKCKDEERKNNLEIIKSNILKFMATNVIEIYGRHITKIMYNPLKEMCTIEYNHFGDKSGKTINYLGVKQHEFDGLCKSNSIAEKADELFNKKAFRIEK